MPESGDIMPINVPTAGGQAKKFRPVLVLCDLPGPYQDVLVCGISSQLRNQQADWDELKQPADADLSAGGLLRQSLRLSYLYGASSEEVTGTIGRISADRLLRLRERLGSHLLGRSDA